MNRKTLDELNRLNEGMYFDMEGNPLSFEKRLAALDALEAAIANLGVR